MDVSKVDPSKVFNLDKALAAQMPGVSVKSAKNCLLAFENSKEMVGSSSNKMKLLIKVGAGAWSEIIKQAGAKVSNDDRTNFSSRDDSVKVKTYWKCHELFATALESVHWENSAGTEKIEN
ncbi:MAG: hypothetical protein JKX72_01115 [Robiginitomaculum sp.]|nr:hypothetical protein [Robiginitomaculum sp.]